jgi:hypothetical protein
MVFKDIRSYMATSPKTLMLLHNFSLQDECTAVSKRYDIQF